MAPSCSSNAACTFAIRFVDHENIRDFHQPSLQALHVVTHPRNQNHDGAIREAHDFDLTLPYADRFDQNHILAGCV